MGVYVETAPVKVGWCRGCPGGGAGVQHTVATTATVSRMRRRRAWGRHREGDGAVTMGVYAKTVPVKGLVPWWRGADTATHRKEAVGMQTTIA